MQNREMVERVARAIQDAHSPGHALNHVSIYQARAAIAAMADWRPIEEAPKDGTEILGWRDDCGVLLVRWTSLAEFLTDAEREQYDEETEHQEDWFIADFVQGSRLENDCVPTHWMPLPEPPSISPLADLVGGEDE